MTASVTSGMAERIADDILSSNSEILSVGVIDKRGNIIATKSSDSFGKRFKGVSSLEGNKYSGTLAVAAHSIANEVKQAFGEPQALITIYRDCKLALLPMPLYDIFIGLALERSVDADDETLSKEIEGVAIRTLKP